MALTALVARAAGATPRRRRRCSCSACSAPRCSTATASSRRRSRCCGAIEGLEVAHAGAQAAASCRSRWSILVGLFVVQRHGTGRVGKAVRPGDAGLVRRARPCSGVSADRRAARRSCAALNPLYGARVPRRSTARRRSSRSARSCWRVTGAEALYADMGHFGRRPIRLGLVRRSCCRRCCSTTSGQGALLLRRPGRARQPVLPPGARTGRCCPLVVLATCATVIASQAVISGAFSMTQQAIQLGFLPRMRIAPHLASARSGRSTCRAVNWLLLVGGGRRGARLRLVDARWPRPTASP